MPIYFREPSINLGVGDNAGLPPHITGSEFLSKFGINDGSALAYSLTHNDFASLARAYGKVGGLDRLTTLVRHIQSERSGKTLLLDGGDTWQGSFTSLVSKGQDMVSAMNLLGTDAMTGHWEFTYGTERVKELIEKSSASFLAGNIVDNEWEEPAFDGIKMYERGGINIAVIGQAFPYTPIANPRYKVPNLSFGIREAVIAGNIKEARAKGAELVVLLSHNGFDVDRKLAGRVEGIDVILSGHTHDALPIATQVNKTLIVASGSHGKFLSRLDLDVSSGSIREFKYRLIPVLADAIAPDPEMRALISDIRNPYRSVLGRTLGVTDSLLYRRGNFNGTFDDIICDALIEERDAEISLSPGFRWGATLLPNQKITSEDVYNVTSITYPNAYRMTMTGLRLKEVLEDVADNLFNPDPYYQQGGDMVRVGGIGYKIDVTKQIGSRISELTYLKNGSKLDPDRDYVVAGWASVREGTQGPPIYDVVSNYISRKQTISVEPNNNVKLVGQ
ncbi:MAG: thiosulfohydrolase SoxB [Rhodospirillaceae bacterium]|nr:thiosulfohydrolase SoxB [Rhodospirillaceae bacterium]